jgi:hypothetical protein
MSARADRPRSRRQLLVDLVAATGGERRRLLELLATERLAVAVYRRAAAAAAVTPAGRLLAGRIEAQELAHALALERLLDGAGPGGGRSTVRSTPRPTRATVAALGDLGIVVQFSALRSEHDWFRLLEELEGALEGAYYKALRHLRDPSVATLTARIMASEAQHSTLLFSFRHPRDIELDVAVGLVKGSAGRG